MAPPFIAAHRSIPEVYGWGRSQFFEYLSLELLGPDLGTWFILMEKPLSSRNLTAIVWQMVRYQVLRHDHGSPLSPDPLARRPRVRPLSWHYPL